MIDFSKLTFYIKLFSVAECNFTVPQTSLKNLLDWTLKLVDFILLATYVSKVTDTWMVLRIMKVWNITTACSKSLDRKYHMTALSSELCFTVGKLCDNLWMLWMWSSGCVLLNNKNARRGHINTGSMEESWMWVEWIKKVRTWYSCMLEEVFSWLTPLLQHELIHRCTWRRKVGREELEFDRFWWWDMKEWGRIPNTKVLLGFVAIEERMRMNDKYQCHSSDPYGVWRKTEVGCFNKMETLETLWMSKEKGTSGRPYPFSTVVSSSIGVRGRLGKVKDRLCGS